MGIFCQNFQPVLDDQKSFVGIARLRQFDLLVRAQHNHLSVVRVKHKRIALTLEAVCNHLHIAEITASMLNEIRYLLIPLSRLPVTW